MSLPPPGRQLSADAATYEFELQLDYACWVRDYDLVRSTLDAMYERKVEMEPNSVRRRAPRRAAPLAHVPPPPPPRSAS